MPLRMSKVIAAKQGTAMDLWDKKSDNRKLVPVHLNKLYHHWWYLLERTLTVFCNFIWDAFIRLDGPGIVC